MQLRYSTFTNHEIIERTGVIDKQFTKGKYILDRDSYYVPDVIIKPSKIICKSPKMKLVIILLGLFLYIYFLVFIKTIYMKTKRLEHIMDMAIETEKQMMKLHDVDSDLEKKIEKVEEMLKGS